MSEEKERAPAATADAPIMRQLNTRQIVADNLLWLSTTLAVFWFLIHGGRI